MKNIMMKTVGIALVSTTMLLSTSAWAHSYNTNLHYVPKSKSLSEAVESMNGYLSAVMPQSFVVMSALMVGPALNLFIDVENFSDKKVQLDGLEKENPARFAMRTPVAEQESSSRFAVRISAQE